MIVSDSDTEVRQSRPRRRCQQPSYSPMPNQENDLSKRPKLEDVEESVESSSKKILIDQNADVKPFEKVVGSTTVGSLENLKLDEEEPCSSKHVPTLLDCKLKEERPTTSKAVRALFSNPIRVPKAAASVAEEPVATNPTTSTEESKKNSFILKTFENVVIQNTKVYAVALTGLHKIKRRADLSIAYETRFHEEGQYHGNDRNIPYFIRSDKYTTNPANPVMKLRFKIRTKTGLTDYRVNSRIEAQPDCLDTDLPTAADEKKQPVSKNAHDYEPQRILLSAKDAKSGRMKFYTKWAEWPVDQCTWETLDSFEVKEEDKGKGKVDLHKQFQQRQRACAEIAKKYNYDIPQRTIASFEGKAASKLMLFERQVDVLCNQFGQGKLFVENWIDGETPNVTFMLENTYSLAVSRKLFHVEDTIDCTCKTCNSKSWCCPQQNDEPFLYVDQGLTKTQVKGRAKRLIECSVSCDCQDKDRREKCHNRIVQHGRQMPLVLFKTRDRGWGIFAAQAIPQGSFISEYVGHVVTMAEAQASENTTYSFDLDGYGENIFSVDAGKRGNEARFVNHSCEPNLKAMPTIVDFGQYSIHRLAYFANRDIRTGEELLIDYFKDGMTNTVVKSKTGKKYEPVHCICGASKCRGTW